MTLDDIVNYYESTKVEESRLKLNIFQLEYERTIELLNRFLPSPPAVVCDIGGGTGAYATYLAENGYEVHYVDPVPFHINSVEKSGLMKTINMGDARNLCFFQDNFADIVLLFGPLYHLTERDDRILAINEAHRILKKDGLLLTTHISRYITALYEGFTLGRYSEKEFVKTSKEILDNGFELHPSKLFFTEAYFQEPEEIEEEIKSTKFCFEEIFPIESIACTISNFNEWWNDKEKKKLILEIIRKVENKKSLLGATAHIMTKSVKK